MAEAGRWSSFVALGDSFTEGLDDPDEHGGFRGWADRTAERLAADRPGFRYANLAIRGRLLRQVVTEQLPGALEMKPDLVSFAAGANDILRRRVDMAALEAAYEDAIATLRSTGATVVVFTMTDLSVKLPGTAFMSERIAWMLTMVHRVAATHGATVVDLRTDTAFADRRMWSEDRLHLNAVGHQRVAGHVLTALGVVPDPSWFAPLPDARPRRPLDAVRENARWTRVHLLPWVGRRLRGRSSGDHLSAKRPTLDAL